MTFPPDFTIRWKSQVYRAIMTVPRQRKDGTPGIGVLWETECPQCGDTFTLVTGLTFQAPTRRCRGCARPFVPVEETET